MQPVTALFMQAIRRPHTSVCMVDVWLQGSNITPPNYFDRGLPITGGAVTVDATAQVRRTLTLTVADPGLDPATAQSLLAPYGTELRVRRGVQYPNGSIEWVVLGWFRIDDATITISGESGPTEVAITGSDRMAWLVDDRFFFPTPSVQTTVVNEIKNHLLADAIPAWAPAFINQTTDATACPKLTFDDKDRAAALANVAAAINSECFINADGAPVLRIIPKVKKSATVWTIDAGTGGAMTSISPDVSRQNIYNAVVATGENTNGDPAFFAIARDQNLLSATNWDGPFGHKVVFYSSPILTSDAKCLTAAQSKLSQYTGAGWNITVETIVNPALDAGDTVTVALPDGRLQYHVVDGITIPLDNATAMAIVTRSNDPAGDVDA